MPYIITSVTVEHNYKLRLIYSDGGIVVVDFTPIIRQGGVFAPLSNPNFFSQVKLGEGPLPEIFASPPTAASNNEQRISPEKWAEIDAQLIKSLKEATKITKKFAEDDIYNWSKKTKKRIDPFLDWYFNFWHVKATEALVPFAWLAFKVDFLAVLRSAEERNLNANQVIGERMNEEFNRKFSEIVLNQEARLELENIINLVGKMYDTTVRLQFAKTQAYYHVDPVEWEEHIRQIAKLSNPRTGTELTSKLANESFTIVAGAIGLKIVAKGATKLGAKGAGFVAAEELANFINPLVGIGVIIWDIWDYDNMVSKSRPQLKKDLEDYITEFTYSMLENASGTGIIDAIDEVQDEIIQGISSTPFGL